MAADARRNVAEFKLGPPSDPVRCAMRAGRAAFLCSGREREPWSCSARNDFGQTCGLTNPPTWVRIRAGNQFLANRAGGCGIDRNKETQHGPRAWHSAPGLKVVRPSRLARSRIRGGLRKRAGNQVALAPPP